VCDITHSPCEIAGYMELLSTFLANLQNAEYICFFFYDAMSHLGTKLNACYLPKILRIHHQLPIYVRCANTKKWKI